MVPLQKICIILKWWNVTLLSRKSFADVIELGILETILGLPRWALSPMTSALQEAAEAIYRQKDVWVRCATQKKEGQGNVEEARKNFKSLLRGAVLIIPRLWTFIKNKRPVVHSCSVYGNLSWQPQETNATSKTENPTHNLGQ